MDPEIAISAIITLGTMIHDQVEKVKINHEQCKTLSQRIDRFMPMIQGLNNVKDKKKYQPALKEFKKCLEKCRTFIEKFTKKKAYLRFIQARSINDKFGKLNVRLKKSMADFHLGIDIQGLINHEQDKVDQQKDYAQIINEIKQVGACQKEVLETLIQKISTSSPTPTGTGSSPNYSVDSNFIIELKDIHWNKMIGRGSLGAIFYGQWCKQEVAVKVLLGEFSEQDRQRFIREVQIISRLRSPNIVQTFGACLESNQLCLVMEYMQYGSLYDLLMQSTLNFTQKHDIALDSARGLHYLHSHGIIHRNLKTTNILINDKLKAKISSFSSSKVPSTESTGILSMTSIGWAHSSYSTKRTAPEISAVQPAYTKKSDIYSYGLVLLELLMNRRPHLESSFKAEIMQQIIDEALVNIPKEVPKKYIRTIKKCLSNAPDKRPTTKNIIHGLKTYEASITSAEQLCEQGNKCEEELKDYHAAASFYKQAADQGSFQAMTRLGFFYIKGLAGQKDKAQASQFFLKAAQNGDPNARYNLGLMYQFGDGIQKDHEKALYWLNKAIEVGNENAEKMVAKLATGV